jgi:hypothetical protein
MLRSWSIALPLLMASDAATSQNAASIYGVGSHTCGTYLDNRAKVPNAGQIYATWVYGLISGHNLFTSGSQIRRDQIEEAAIVAYLDKACREEPFSSVVTGSFKLMAELGWRPSSKK